MCVRARAHMLSLQHCLPGENPDSGIDVCGMQGDSQGREEAGHDQGPDSLQAAQSCELSQRRNGGRGGCREESIARQLGGQLA